MIVDDGGKSKLTKLLEKEKTLIFGTLIIFEMYWETKKILYGV